MTETITAFIGVAKVIRLLFLSSAGLERLHSVTWRSGKPWTEGWRESIWCLRGLLLCNPVMDGRGPSVAKHQLFTCWPQFNLIARRNTGRDPCPLLHTSAWNTRARERNRSTFMAALVAFLARSIDAPHIVTHARIASLSSMQRCTAPALKAGRCLFLHSAWTLNYRVESMNCSIEV